MNGAYREMTEEEKVIAQKPWSELTSEQKVERLRINLMAMSHIPIALDSLQKDMGKIKRHQHGSNGQLLLPMDEFSEAKGLGLMSGTRLNNKEFNSLY